MIYERIPENHIAAKFKTENAYKYKILSRIGFSESYLKHFSFSKDRMKYAARELTPCSTSKHSQSHFLSLNGCYKSSRMLVRPELQIPYALPCARRKFSIADWHRHTRSYQRTLYMSLQMIISFTKIHYER
jgi:hypothetical protein